MERSPPPPPERKNRRPFVTNFLRYIFPFLSEQDLLVCTFVSRTWRKEAISSSLGRSISLSETSTGIQRNNRYTLDENHNISLQESLVSSTGRNNSQGESIFRQNDFFQPFQNRVGKEVRIPFNRYGNSNSLSSGISSVVPFTRRNNQERSNLLNEEWDLPLNLEENINSLMKSMETIKIRTIQLKKQAISSTSSFNIIKQNMPSIGAIKLHRECLIQWQNQEIFEEIVVNSLCSSFEGLTLGGGLRFFIHAEMASLGVIGSPVYIQWSRFKKALPLDDRYYDYLDCLYSFGPGKIQLLDIDIFEENSVRKKIERFKLLRNIVEDVIKVRKSESKHLSWNDFLNRLEIGYFS